VRFTSPPRVEPGQVIEVEVTLPGAGPSSKEILVSGAGYIVRVEAGNKPGWYKLAAEFDEPPAGDETGWPPLQRQVLG